MTLSPKQRQGPPQLRRVAHRYNCSMKPDSISEEQPNPIYVVKVIVGGLVERKERQRIVRIETAGWNRQG